MPAIIFWFQLAISFLLIISMVLLVYVAEKECWIQKPINWVLLGYTFSCIVSSVWPDVVTYFCN